MFFLYSPLRYIKVWLCWICSSKLWLREIGEKMRTQQMGSKIWPENNFVIFFYVRYVVKMYTQLKRFCIIGSDDHTLAIFLVFLNPESTPSQHDLNMFMSLFLCDAAKEITPIVHNHTRPDDPNAVFLHLKFSPHFSYKHKNSATERSPLCCSLCSCCGWLLSCSFSAWRKYFHSIPYERKVPFSNRALFTPQQNEQNRSLPHSCHWENAQNECPAFSFWSSLLSLRATFLMSFLLEQ